LINFADLKDMGRNERRRHRRLGWEGAVRLLISGGAQVQATIADLSESDVGCKPAGRFNPARRWESMV